jgi:hypothetical protein
LTEELIKVIQGRFGYLHAQGLVGMIANAGGRLSDVLTQCQLPGALRDDLAVEAVEALAVFQHRLHTRNGMNLQQFQDAGKVPPSRQRSVARFQTLTKFLENRRQLPLAKNVRVIQGGGPTLQRGQVMQRVEYLAAGFVAALMPGNHLAGDDDLDAFDVGFDRRRLKGAALRHAVTHLVEPGRLIFVDLGLLIDASVERHIRQRQGPLPIALKALADRLGVLAGSACAILGAAVAQIDIEFGQVLGVRHRRGPTSLQGFDAILHVRLLVAVGRHAKERLEDVVTGQDLIARMQLPLPAAEDRRRHGPGIVPPHFARHAAEELETLHHAFQDRFGTFARQGHGEGIIRVRPDQHEHRDLLSALGKVNVDVAEICFEPLARIARERDKSLDVLASHFADVAAHGIVAAKVAVLVAQSLKNTAEGVPLLGRRMFIVRKNLLYALIEAAELLGWRFADPSKRLRLRIGYHFADLASRMMKRASDGANAHAIAMGLTNA